MEWCVFLTPLEPFFKDNKGVVEADRIDFIRRDGAFSGLFASAIDYGRLFTLYTLDNVGDDAHKHIVALPSIRSASETEKLLWERFQDYKYIVMHHKVHLYDEIVENIIIHLIADGKLDNFLDDLIGLLDFTVPKKSLYGKSGQFELLKAVLLQFDDPWLESHIRNVYREIIESQFEGKRKKKKKDNHDSYVLFQVYVEERKRFTSAFKSDCEFWNAVVDTKTHMFETLRPEGPVLTKEEASYRKHFFNSLYAGKLALQKLIKNQLGGITVIIGPTEKKVNYGVRDEDEARSYQVSELVNYLKHKKYGTMLFNLWYESESGLTKKDFLERTMPIIEKFAAEAIIQAKIQAKLSSN